MFDNKQLKTQGLRFARSLQTLVKMVNMFSADHKSVDGLLRRTYDLLNPLVKQSRCLTIGFVDQRVLLNNILTDEDSLKPLENEFLKRGVGAVTFDAGITLAAFTRAMAALAANPKLIDECGGLLPFLSQQQLEFVRIFPASKNEVRNQDGDTVLEMGSEEYLISKALSSMKSASTQGIEAILGQLEASGGEGGGFGGGGFGDGVAKASGLGGGSAEGSGGSGGGGTGTGVGGSGTGGGGIGLSDRRVATIGYSGGYLTEVQRLTEQKFETLLRNPEEDPQKAYMDLAKMLSGLHPEGVLGNLAGGAGGSGGGAGGGSGKEEVTTEVFEDTALRWALRRLAVVPAGDEAVVVEEQIFRVLMRSLQATHAASRLAQKLAEFAKEYALPRNTFERLQEEVHWLTLTPQKKLLEVLGVEHFTSSQFRRALDLIKELMRSGSSEEAIAVGVQYFSIFDDHKSIRVEEIGRIPDLLRALSGIQGEFWAMAEERLAHALVSDDLNQFMHVQVVNAMVALSRIAATYEDFMLVKSAGAALEESLARDAAAHDLCCRAALPVLLPPPAVDRIAEIFLEKKNDSAWVKNIVGLLRWSDQKSIERIFLRLDKEQITANRLALVRFLGRVGPAGLSAARQRLKSNEWYIVRNACKILGELKDPELLEQLLPVLAHSDARVQKAAFQAVKESRLPGQKATLAKALPFLSSSILEEVVAELAFHPSAELIAPLDEYFQKPPAHTPRAMMRVVDVLASITDPPAGEALARVEVNHLLDDRVRLAAQKALTQRTARLRVAAQDPPTDPGLNLNIA